MVLFGFYLRLVLVEVRSGVWWFSLALSVECGLGCFISLDLNGADFLAHSIGAQLLQMLLLRGLIIRIYLVYILADSTLPLDLGVP